MDVKHHKWARIDDRALARFVQPAALPQALRWPVGLNRLDVLTSSGIYGVAEQLYEQLHAQALQYDLAPPNPDAAAVQLIRKASVVLEGKLATCLDLAVVFAALCLDNDLLPIIVLLEGHALAGFSLRRTLRSTQTALKPLAWELGRLDHLETLRELVDNEYALVECTGVAQSRSLTSIYPEGQDRDADGRMSFSRACAAGRQQILSYACTAEEIAQPHRRQFLSVLEIRDLQVKYGFEPEVEHSQDPSASGGSELDQQGQTVHGVQTNLVGEVYGPTLSGVYKAPVHVGNIIVGNIIGSTGVAIGSGARAEVNRGGSLTLDGAFQLLFEKVNTLPAGPAKLDALSALAGLKVEAAKGEAADEGRVQRGFTVLADMAPNAWEVAVTTFQSPIPGIGKVFQLEATRAREERLRKDH